MGGSQKSKGVSWASDDYLCQVRLFLSEESPSQVASSAQDHLQAKASWASIPSGMVSDENLPPGFEGSQPANAWTSNLFQIPLIKWKCPPRYIINGAWRVVAGDESQEIELQQQREMRVLEAIYPRHSAIPLDPVLVGAEGSSHFDQNCPLIPITPIEDEDVAADMLNETTSVNPYPMSLQPQPTSPGTSLVDPDVLAMARSALSILTKSNDQGSMIDSELLIKILSDPKLIEQLVRNHGAVNSQEPAPQNVMQSPAITNTQRMVPSATTQGLHMSTMPNGVRAMAPAVSLPANASRTDLHLAHVSRPELVSSAPPGAAFYAPPSRISPAPSMRPMVHESIPGPPPPVAAPVSKDLNYYKSLIQQHGGERQDSIPQSGIPGNHHLATSNVFKPRDSKPKIMKPCAYFNTSRGCRNGANCTYQHDSSSQPRVNSITDSQNAKRMKMDREITGV